MVDLLRILTLTQLQGEGPTIGWPTTAPTRCNERRPARCCRPGPRRWAVNVLQGAQTCCAPATSPEHRPFWCHEAEVSATRHCLCVGMLEILAVQSWGSASWGGWSTWNLCFILCSEKMSPWFSGPWNMLEHAGTESISMGKHMKTW